MAQVAEAAGVSEDHLRVRAMKLAEVNPMLGHRGCRLAITYPEIYEMQARAIFEAAVAVEKESGETVHPEIMIPLVSMRHELQILRELVKRVAREVLTGAGVEVPYEIGTMIELPRACLRAGEIAEIADFFSFGTNDLTQMGFGFSRDDVGGFLQDYLDQKILAADPFQTIDQKGVGRLIEMAVKQGRATRSDLKIGICGEQGGDPPSVDFCFQTGLDYVSCSPYRVPIARLAAAQAAVKAKN